MLAPSPCRLNWKPAAAWVVVLAAAMTGLNAIKPLHMDDTTYFTYAKQIAAHPSDPYGGEVIIAWAPPKAGMDVLVPVALPYAWSWAIRGRAGPIKLWLFPIHLILVGSTWLLARRFTRGFESAIAGMVAFSPAILPGLNVMLDVPSLSLGLLSLVVFIRACERSSIATAIVAGLLAGLSIDTKWTGLLVPVVLGLYALTHRRLGLGLTAAAVAGAVFAGWEGWIAWRYGASHFLTHSGRRFTTILDRVDSLKALVGILGGVAAPILMLGLVALRRRWAAAVVAVWLGLLALGLSPGMIFVPLGIWLVVNQSRVALTLLSRGPTSPPRPRLRGDRDGLFVVLWLAVEVAGFFLLSPYSAVRRALGIVVAATLMTGRLASRTCRAEGERASVRWVAFGGMVLGLGYFGVDLWEARVEQAAAIEAAREAKTLVEPGHTAYFVGRWGFRHYAGVAGLTQLAPGRTELKPGDVLVVPDSKVPKEEIIAIDPEKADEALVLTYRDRFPFATVPAYYSGKLPLARLDEPRFVVRVYRVNRRFVAPVRKPVQGEPGWSGPS